MIPSTDQRHGGPAAAKRQVLLADWRQRLAECESRLADGVLEVAAPRRWMLRMYARVLRYLVRRYERDDAAEAFTADVAVARPADREVALVPLGQGCPAKSAERIRATLDAVHARVPAAAAGPLVGGLSPVDWMLAVSLPHFAQAWWLRRELSFMGIPSRGGGRLSGDGRIWVRRCDFDRAQPAVARVPPCRTHRSLFAWIFPGGSLDDADGANAHSRSGYSWLVAGFFFGGIAGASAGNALMVQHLSRGPLNFNPFSYLWGGAAVGMLLGPFLVATVRVAMHEISWRRRLRDQVSSPPKSPRDANPLE